MKSFIQFIVNEDMPTNNAGGGNVDGIGVGQNGEPGVMKSSVINRSNNKKKRVKNDLSHHRGKKEE